MNRNELIELLLSEKTLYGVFIKFCEIYKLDEDEVNFLLEVNIMSQKKYIEFLINCVETELNLKRA